MVDATQIARRPGWAHKAVEYYEAAEAAVVCAAIAVLLVGLLAAAVVASTWWGYREDARLARERQGTGAFAPKPYGRRRARGNSRRSKAYTAARPMS